MENHYLQSLRHFISDKNGRIVIWQKPNLPLSAWLILVVAARLSEAPFTAVFSELSHVAIIIWAYLEIISGTSPFRRVLGGLVFVLTILNQLT